ncbi:MAG: hypothetical protein WC702_03425 [Patescibacteria group bacterium]|jgi:hypothetical protein
MKKPTNFLLLQQDDFERAAYAYGIQPTVCTLLGEVVYRKLRAAWQNGWWQAIGRLSTNVLPAETNN